MVKLRGVFLLLVAGALAACGAAGGGAAPRPAQHASQSSATVHRAVALVPPAPRVPAVRPKPKPKPAPAPGACAGNTEAQLVLVSVAQQHAWLCARTRLVYATAVTTGAVDLPYDSTPLGNYRVQARNTDTTLTQLSGAQYHVKYWIPFDSPLFGFHDSSWQQFPYGSPRYRTEGSHGCIHMPLAAMQFLYDWAGIGAAVTIRA